MMTASTFPISEKSVVARNRSASICLDRLSDFTAGDVLDKTFLGVDRIDFRLIDIEAGDRDTRTRELKGKAYVSETDDSNEAAFGGGTKD